MTSKLSNLLFAIAERKKIEVDYVDVEDVHTIRIIRPYHAFTWNRRQYLMGFCEMDDDIRNFRVSRIKRCDVLDEIFSDEVLSIDQYKAQGRLNAFKDRYRIKCIDSTIKRASPSHDLQRPLPEPKQPYTVSPDTVKTGKHKYDGSFDDRYPTKYFSSKLINNPATCRSPIEKEIFEKLDANPKILSYWSEPVRIPFIAYDERHVYVPDVLLKFTNGNRMIVEIKSYQDADNPENIVKYEALQKYCDEHRLTFQVWTLEKGVIKKIAPSNFLKAKEHASIRKDTPYIEIKPPPKAVEDCKQGRLRVILIWILIMIALLILNHLASVYLTK